jgi:alpha-glucoside transport system permease protein
MTDQILQTVLAVVVSVGLCLLYFYGTNFVLDRIVAMPFASRNRREGVRALVQPWLFVLPALALLGVYLVYPLFETARLSFMNDTGEQFVGLANYKWVLVDPNFLITIRNNFMWLLVVPAMATLMGLIVAVLADRYPERPGDGHGAGAPGLGHRALLEQLLPHGHPDLDTDRVCHGDSFGRPARCADRHH